MDASYRNRYSASPGGFSPGSNIYAPNPSAYSQSPPPTLYPKAEQNLSPTYGFSQNPLLLDRNAPEMPRVQTRTPIPVPAPAVVPDPYPVHVNRPKTFAQWVAGAKDNTADVMKNGSPSPLIWVLVEGKNIPENALVGGEDRRKPLYIARSFYEGGIHIGKAGHHLRLGATIPYNSKEIEISTYEVLVPALQPVRYSVINSPSMKDIARMVQNPQGLQRLSEIKTVVLVDDSMSMAGPGLLWDDAREALASVADIAAQYGSEGVDVFFLNNHRYSIGMKDGQSVRELFNSVDPDGQTPTGRKLEEIFDRYIPYLEDRRLVHKPIAIVVITDGVPTDDPKAAIINAARRLDHNGVPERSLGIQFVQIGDDQDATEALQELDDDIAGAHGVRDMVDTIPFNPDDPQFTVDTMIKILLGSINALLDSAPSRQPSVSATGNNYRR